jgi:hypothetical protein
LLLNSTAMTYSWTTDLAAGRASGQEHFPNTEGIDRYMNKLYFVSKIYKSMFILDLNDGTYSNVTTKNGAFDGQPDQIVHILNATSQDFAANDYIFFTEDGGTQPGLFARNKDGDFYTILEATGYAAESTTGLAFSPDGKHLYFALQDVGLTFEITRLDGLGFQGKTVNVQYHLVQ